MCLEVRIRLLRVERIRIWGVFSLRRSVSMAGGAVRNRLNLGVSVCGPVCGQIGKE